MTTDGGNLRDQLEGALKRIKEQEEKISDYEVRETAAEFSLVNESDLKGYDGDLKEKAAEIQEQRLDQQKTLLAQAGLGEDEIAKVLAGEAVSSTSKGHPVGEVGNLPKGAGKVPPKTTEVNLHGRSAIKAHFDAEAAEK